MYTTSNLVAFQVQQSNPSHSVRMLPRPTIQQLTEQTYNQTTRDIQPKQIIALEPAQWSKRFVEEMNNGDNPTVGNYDMSCYYGIRRISVASNVISSQKLDDIASISAMPTLTVK